ncbi:LuxR family transcriptional regulator [Streptomyces sp. AcE210]|uniref:helix-turn-helix transcriptional regulator n=1 Tax=Streptomyces sp. AcE210 TaxID=2292703 RepID=UPI00140517B7|nr:LuxR family transcriptional regulator [Streptomyces sp. AcE210]
MFVPEPSSGLAALGLKPMAEQVYVFLIDQGGEQTAQAVEHGLELPATLVTEILGELEHHLLVVRTTDCPPRYSARPPEPALESLVLRRGDELARIRMYAKELQSRFREVHGTGAPSDQLEVVVGESQVVRHYEYMLENAKRELSVFTMPPFVIGGQQQVESVRRSERDGIRRGVRYRTVYDSAALDEPFALAIAQHSVSLGEEARVIGDLPLKLLLMDRSTGFVPLQTDNPAAGSVILRPSPLLDALIALFEGVWAKAVPLGPPALPQGPTELDERSRQIVLLLSGGLKDESIARVLGVSRRTVQKHVSSIMETLGAKTRFQAALLARERGWTHSGGGGREVTATQHAAPDPPVIPGGGPPPGITGGADQAVNRSGR